MNNIVRAWKDEAYRQSLSVEEQAMLPANPAGEIELTEADLEAISGASSSNDSNLIKENLPQNTTYNPFALTPLCRPTSHLTSDLWRLD
mgnify:CR=1 FL=1